MGSGLKNMHAMKMLDINNYNNYIGQFIDSICTKKIKAYMNYVE